MRDLFQTSHLKAAGLAALFTVLACVPRLLLWLGPQKLLSLFISALLWSAFFLWGFVFAWHQKYSGRPVFRIKIPAKLWIVATLCGIAGGMAMHLWLDPVLKRLTPQDYPRNFEIWMAMTLFALALDQLFLCFAPFAFFLRLLRRPVYAIWGTAWFALFVLALKLNSSPILPPIGIIASLVLVRLAGTLLSLHFYLHGGALLAWWWVLVLQLRHLLSF